jgi:hypothetical protein
MPTLFDIVQTFWKVAAFFGTLGIYRENTLLFRRGCLVFVQMPYGAALQFSDISAVSPHIPPNDDWV